MSSRARAVVAGCAGCRTGGWRAAGLASAAILWGLGVAAPVARAERPYRPNLGNDPTTEYWARKQACSDKVWESRNANLATAPNLIEFWVRAFIPFNNPTAHKVDVASVEDTARGAIHVINNPGWPGYSATDQRDFKTDVKASSRLVARLVFNTSTLELVSADSWSDCTFHVDPATAVVESQGQGHPEIETSVTKTGNTLTGRFKVYERQPLIPLSRLAPIKIKGTFVASATQRTIVLDSLTSEFPAFEFLVSEGGKLKSLKNQAPGPGVTVMALAKDFGDPPVSNHFEIPFR